MQIFSGSLGSNQGENLGSTAGQRDKQGGDLVTLGEPKVSEKNCCRKQNLLLRKKGGLNKEKHKISFLVNDWRRKWEEESIRLGAVKKERGVMFG